MKTIRKVLIANRGEIALRIMNTLKEMGIEAIAVYEKPDYDAYFLRFADRAIKISDEPGKGYLNIERIIDAALKSGADAVHPGYGFLAENPNLAAACERAGILFIGPPPSVIRDLGDKVLARETMHKAGIPIIPGTNSFSPGNAGIEEALAFARQCGYPIILKATAGGGGRGVRKIENEQELMKEMPLARAEALLAFHDDRIYAEKFIVNPRHIEVQILADTQGNVVHLGTRDCSIQRRHQKLLEIAPAELPSDVTAAIHAAAVKAAVTAGYVNAGTVEFLVDAKTSEFWFMEVNTRLQVEHTVSEMITGEDIVQHQIRIAEGHPLGLRQEDIQFNGIAIEVRINAEDPKSSFLPEGGKMIEIYESPGGPGVRVDGAIYKGYRVPTVYDSLLVKLIVRGYQWDQTVQRLKRALKDFTIVWPKTTIPLYLAICDEPDFLSRKFDTSYLETHPAIFRYPDLDHYILEETVYKTSVTVDEHGQAVITDDRERKERTRRLLEKRILTTQEIEELKREGIIKSSIKGKVNRVLVDVGDEVFVGDILIDLEAMKMHTHVVAELDGRVSDVLIEPGDSVDVGDTMIVVCTGDI
ncbi:MAG: biotin/lipoyl-binding protein [Syntrophaceae bacterium]|nr:biotin/lipoyl-binding protein [Syntrophaceae bacterium]